MVLMMTTQRLLVPLLLMALLLAPFGARAAAAESSGHSGLVLHVATNGDDAWSGHLAQPNAKRTDGPLASLTGARDAIRQARAAARARGPVTVLIRGGRYSLDAPVVFEPQDSGAVGAPVVYAADRNERPVFSGGRVLNGFRQVGRLWQCAIPDVPAGRWYFRQLCVNGQRRQRARSPNTGYYRVANLLTAGRDAQGKPVPDKARFVFAPGDIQPWARLHDVNVMLMHSWETSIHPIQSVDPVAHIVEFTAPLKEWWTIGYWEKHQRYYIENAFEALDEPGEWYLNRDTGVLSYWPLPGEPLGAIPIVAPRLTELVRFAGNADEGRLVQHVTLRGLVFHDADWQLDPRGESSTQAAVEVPAAVMADGAVDCAFEDCEVAHVGTYGVWFRRGCKQCRIAHNRLFDLGAGGVRVGEATRAASDAAVRLGNLPGRHVQRLPR